MEPGERITRYFEACSSGAPTDIASHFTADAVIYDTNLEPFRGAVAIGESWSKIRNDWQGARWTVDSLLSDGAAAAIEWSMTGTDPRTGEGFVFRGSEHYRFVDGLIDEIRQYWTFDRARLTTGLRCYPYDPR
ncbi:MAG: nuclear transport factor 2 family protein [Actinomycetota bacterium]|nr:nuclear transport factor 2 family protein [Actinomycetota bacterium]